MAGYFLYTIDYGIFSQLTSSRTKEQAMILAGPVAEDMADADSSDRPWPWPADADALAEVFRQRLASADWYSDLDGDAIEVWEDVLFSLQDEAGDALGLDFQCSDYESIYWDCAEFAAEQGADMMAEPAFGSSGFRYFGKPTAEYPQFPMYSLFAPQDVQKLLAQLRLVEAEFDDLEDDDEGSVREQFFEGLLPAVQYAAENQRMLWVQTDT